MHFSIYALLLGALSSHTGASPAGSLARGNKYSVTQVSTGRKINAGPVALLNAYQKFGTKIPGYILDAAAAVKNGTVTATPEPEPYDEEYVSPVSVGKSALTLQFDTGSSDLWVFSKQLPAAQSKGHALYNLSGKKLQGATWNITYADQSTASGDVYIDKVNVGGVVAAKQAVEAAQKVSPEFVTDTNSDGVFGLAFDSLNRIKPKKQPTFFDNVKSSLSSPLFAALLKKGAPRVYDFGFIDTTKFTGNIAYAAVNSAKGFWQITTTQYSVGSGTPNTVNIEPIVDTGTSVILLPKTIVQSYYNQVTGASFNGSAGGFAFPCTATLPDFSIYVGDSKVTTPGVNINYAPLGGGNCFGGIQSSGSNTLAVLGDCFLKGQYVVFDTTGPRVGFAAQA